MGTSKIHYLIKSEKDSIGGQLHLITLKLHYLHH